MSKVIELTDEQWEALLSGEEIVIKPQATKKEWQPEGGQWVVDFDSNCMHLASEPNADFVEFGVFYPTKEKAELASKFMRRYNRYLAYAIEHWHDALKTSPPQYDWYIYRDDDGTFIPSQGIGVGDDWTPYGPQEKVQDLADRLNRGEVKF